MSDQEAPEAARREEGGDVKKHPRQPVVMDSQGVARFKHNAIVRHLLDTGRCDMNAIARMPFSREDREQFAQLIGYSVSGAGDLSYMSKELIAEADAEVEKMIAEEKGMKDVEIPERVLVREWWRVESRDVKTGYNRRDIYRKKKDAFRWAKFLRGAPDTYELKRVVHVRRYRRLP